MTPSAVKCIHAYDLCGYCDLCGGYLKPDANNFPQLLKISCAQRQLFNVGLLKNLILSMLLTKICVSAVQNVSKVAPRLGTVPCICRLYTNGV